MNIKFHTIILSLSILLTLSLSTFICINTNSLTKASDEILLCEIITDWDEELL